MEHLFALKVIQLLTKMLAIDWHYWIDIPYHPQSAGVVDRKNRVIKGRLTKACLDTVNLLDDCIANCFS